MNRGLEPQNVKLWQQKLDYKDTVEKEQHFFI